MRIRKTDYGTIILHWALVVGFVVAFITGMRIATEAPERGWINSFDAVLPQNVWVLHMQAAVVLVAVAIAYTIYVLRSGLGRRIRLDKVRLRGLVGRGQARRGAVNIVLYWVFFITMLGLMGSGGLLYFGYYAGNDMVTLHWYGTWMILGFAGFHVLSHFRIGGTSQLLRIFRPTGLSAPPPQLDAVELLTMLVDQQSARLQPELERPDRMQSEPFKAQPQPMRPPRDTARDQRPAGRNNKAANAAPRTAMRKSPRLQPEFERADRIPMQPKQPPREIARETAVETAKQTARNRWPAARNSVAHPAPRTATERSPRLQPEFERADRIPMQPMQPPKDSARDRWPAARNSAPHPMPRPAVESSPRLQPDFEHADRIPSEAFEAYAEPMQPPRAGARDRWPAARNSVVRPPSRAAANNSARLQPDFERADRIPSEIFEAYAEPMQPPRDNSFGRRPAPRNSVGTAAKGRASKPRNPTFQSNPFIVAAIIAIAGASVVVATDRMAVDQLQVHRITTAEAPILDGDTSDRAWRGIRPFSVMTSQGGNFDGKGETRIDIRAVHDGTWAYFLFTWEDPTRSLKQLPLIKEIDGWHLLHNGYESGDEHDYNEDKFSVLLTTLDVTLAGDRTFHAGPHPVPDAPATMTGRGLHFTTSEGIYADVWQWKATSTATGWMDDDHFGPPQDPTPMQVSGAVPYKGGFAPDPGTANYSDNFVMTNDGVDGGNRTITPLRLPADLAATLVAMGTIDIDPNHGESDGARWYMTEAESIAYSPEQDARIPVGTVIPGVIIAGDYSGDRADVRCAARWASGHWALEVARRLDTHSKYDIPIQTGVFMRVSAFDHSQIRHTRHVRPIRLEVE